MVGPKTGSDTPPVEPGRNKIDNNAGANYAKQRTQQCNGMNGALVDVGVKKATETACKQGKNIVNKTSLAKQQKHFTLQARRPVEQEIDRDGDALRNAING